jgi:hypothetical protein
MMGFSPANTVSQIPTLTKPLMTEQMAKNKRKNVESKGVFKYLSLSNAGRVQFAK